MAHEEIKALRSERGRLPEGLQQRLGNQRDRINDRQLTERISEFTDANRRLNTK
ncbi:hypothetical protein [Streptomyces sp. NPDC005374]|uniref:hypothetical protein n=1 Tax=Streptomyces sp. NPDC005374 TaxID=3364713 RepID=UPI00367E6056